MNRLSRSIADFGRFLLDNHWRAFLFASVLALLPHTAWLASAIIALITLRKGPQYSRSILFAVVTVYFACSALHLSVKMSLVKSLLEFLPSFILAYALRKSASWRVVAGCCFLMIFTFVLFIQLFIPEMLIALLMFFKATVTELQPNSHLANWLISEEKSQQFVLANYLLGMQATGVVFSAILSVLMGRWVQSLIFYPGGFQKEMYAFQADKIGLFLLGGIGVGAWFGNTLAMSLIPALLFYFALAGLSLGYNVLATKRPPAKFLLLFTPLLLAPYIMLPVYLLFGSLDSLFNLRIYLPNKAEH